MNWKTIAIDGYPSDKNAEYFIWGDGWDTPMVASFYENNGAIGFCTSGGSIDATHWQVVIYPENPTK